MARQTKLHPLSGISRDHEDALVASGLVDDVVDPSALDPRPCRYAEGEVICRHGDSVDCLWVIVSGSVAVKERGASLFVRRRNEVVGEQHLVGNGYRRIYDLVAAEASVELLAIDRSRIEAHPEAGAIWRNIARIISTKLRNASRKTSSLSRQLADDTRILHAYTNEYALARRFRSGSMQQTGYQVDKAIIWFSDVADFSRHTSNMSPDRIADIVQRFFNAQSMPILARDGHIDKFMGDGMMAFWVLPHEDSNPAQECLKALRAAEEAVQAVAGISIGTSPLSLRVGLHVGLVISGDFGSATRHQFTLIGTEVNKAARLEQVRGQDIVEGGPHLGSIRLSREFHHELSSTLQLRYGTRLVSRAKNIGDLELFCASDQQPAPGA